MKFSRKSLLGLTSFSLFLVMTAPFARAEAPKMGKDETLRAEPAVTAASVGTATSGSPVSLKERKGFWQQVQVGNLTGWVKLSSIALGDGDTAASGLAAMATGRGASGNVVAASGTRGLSAEELSSARPDQQELARLLAISVPAAAKAEFVSQAKLSPRSIPYIMPSR